jgi:hypothetical protein
MRLFALAVSLCAFSSLVHAADSSIPQYRYDTELDIARVVSIKTPKSPTCQLVTAVMTYEDSKGEIHKLAYTVRNNDCYNQN